MEEIKDNTRTAPPKLSDKFCRRKEKRKMFSIGKNISRAGSNSAAVFMKLSLCPAPILFTVMKDSL